MKTYNIAVIGTGFMGKTHSLSASSLKFYYDCGFSVALHTLCGRDTEKTRAMARRLGFEHATCDFEGVAGNPEIDIIDVCTPNPLHYSQVKAAILAGKHVYCDKPLCVTAKEAYELSSLAKQSGRVCQVTFQHRFWPAVMLAKQMITEGRIGDIISFRALFLHSSLTDENKPYAWRNAPVRQGGGVLNDLGSHILDLLIYLCGDIENICSVTETLYTHRPAAKNDNGEGSFPPKEQSIEVTSDDAAFMLIRLKNGACGTAEASKLAAGLDDVLKIEIHGKTGALMFDLTRPGELKYYSGDGFKTINCLQKYGSPCDFLNGANLPGWIRAHIHSYFCFADNIDKGRAPSPSFEDAARVQEIIEKARENRVF